MTHLISAAGLAHEIEDVVVIDVRWALTAGRAPSADDAPVGWADYVAGHVPGACFVDLDTELAAPPGEGGRHPLPEPAVVERALRRCGVRSDSRIVVYDGRESYAAARAWWVLRWVGLTDVRVLNGGYAAWLAAGLPVSTEVPGERHGDVVVTAGFAATTDAAGAARWADHGVLLDARAPQRYAGETEPIDPVAGHIPGGINSPTTDWLAADGTFRRDLAEHWATVSAGHEDEPVAVYCGSGVTAAHLVLALAEVGVDATLYPGSWSEWIRDPSRPIALGPTPG
ncbi:3-mercaptopyruvate sulfurtransferase [Intrasporangium oryzae NRRL B-24470]|uniref:Sulfurtransferase n=1 Tax=Intrasporangium oryzae NRRL B-24470 TaxID=1386089 RepID=W9GHQ5_9MICO|nr:3-mercaptopyruvate sulfurtransferase [Intrasporangium oryzae NRRL B-24470]